MKDQNSNQIKSAIVANVKIGCIIILGLQDEDGKYYVGVPQIDTEFQFNPASSSRDIKHLLGNGFQFNKLKTSLHPKAINAINILDFERLLAKLDRKGNLKAQELRDDLVGLSLYSLFNDAFGLKFEKEERDKWLMQRQQGKQTRRLFQDSVSDYCLRHKELSDNYRKYIHKNCTDKLYRALFGKPAAKLKDKRNVVGELRSFFDFWELSRLEKHEEYAGRLIDKQDIEPQQAIGMSIEFYSN